MRVRELMRAPVVTIGSDESADEALRRMRRHRIRHLVVTSDGELAGMISERDLGGPHGEATRRGRSVDDLMTARVVSARPTMTLRDAANLMRGHMIGSLPVVKGRELVGIVTATDVLDALGSGSTRPTRRPESRTLRMTESRRQSKRRKITRRASGNSPVGRARERQPDSAMRAPFASFLPRALKRKLPAETQEVPAHIRAADGELSADDRMYIRRKLGRRLGKFASSIERVSVRTQDVNGPRGGVDQVCRIKVVLSGLPSVVYEQRDASLTAAVDGALAGTERVVRRALGRRRMKPIRQAA
jgi:CBS domain-containing protein